MIKKFTIVVILSAATALNIVAPADAQATQNSVAKSPTLNGERILDAAKLGRTDILKILIDQKADLDIKNNRGFTPLILAAYYGHAEAVGLLIESGANPCITDEEGMGNNALMGVAFKGYDSIAETLLKTACDVNARNKSGQTALMMAALFGRTAQIEMLLAAGARTDIADFEGRTAHSVARAQGHEIIARKLAPKQAKN